MLLAAKIYVWTSNTAHSGLTLLQIMNMIRRYHWLTSFAVIVGIVTFDSTCGGAEQLAGDWVGGFEDDNDYVFHQLHFKITDEETTGTYDLPLLFQRGRSLKNLAIKSSTVTFAIPNQPEQVFAGELKDGDLVGQMTAGGAKRLFRFTRLAVIQPERYVGTYQIESGHFVFIRAAVELGLGALQFIDFKTGRLGVLFPTTTREFFIGPAVLVPHPIEARATFSFDAKRRATGFKWAGGERWAAQRANLTQEEVSFTNENVTISGTLISPHTPPPHPVIVCVPASTAAASREMFRHMGEFLAGNGVASLIYDKRGIGRSTGDWMQAGFDDLAEDALAAVRMLKTRQDIDSSHIGLFGASQSGWIVALAASKSADVAFIISQSGPGVCVEEQELYRSEAWLRSDDFSEDEIRDAMRFIRRRYKCARTGEGWDELAEVAREAEKKSWFVYAGGHAGKDHPYWRFFNRIRDYNPVPVIEKVTCPALIRIWRQGYVPTRRHERADLEGGVR